MKTIILSIAICLSSISLVDAQTAWNFSNSEALFNGRVLIGRTTTLPSIFNLNVFGSSSFVSGINGRFVLCDNWDQTVGINSPKLSFWGTTTPDCSAINGPSIQKIHDVSYGSYGQGRLAFLQHSENNYTQETEVMSILPNGNVGIGTSNPVLAKLQVNGSIQATDVNVSGKILAPEIEVSDVNVSGMIKANDIEIKNVAADFVFEEGYKLNSPVEIEKYVNKHKHLPGIAPASETSKGTSVSEFNTFLLQKVEELTLYMILQNKRIEKLENENLSLKNRTNN